MPHVLVEFARDIFLQNMESAVYFNGKGKARDKLKKELFSFQGNLEG